MVMSSLLIRRVREIQPTSVVAQDTLQQKTFLLRLWFWLWAKNRPNRLIENCLQTLLSQS